MLLSSAFLPCWKVVKRSHVSLWWPVQHNSYIFLLSFELPNFQKLSYCFTCLIKLLIITFLTSVENIAKERVRGAILMYHIHCKSGVSNSIINKNISLRTCHFPLCLLSVLSQKGFNCNTHLANNLSLSLSI